MSLSMIVHFHMYKHRRVFQKITRGLLTATVSLYVCTACTPKELPTAAAAVTDKTPVSEIPFTAATETPSDSDVQLAVDSETPLASGIPSDSDASSDSGASPTLDTTPDSNTLPANDTPSHTDAPLVSDAPLDSDASPDTSAPPFYPAEWPDGLRNPYPDHYKTQPLREDGYSNEKTGWYYNRNNEHQPPTAQSIFDIRLFGAYYLGDITRKTLYLTFDEGYENGYTGEILDILRDKNVPAAFFMTQTYLRDNPELTARIAAEGHVAANHSVRHISFPDLTDEELASELSDTAQYYKELTGCDMDRFVRPPAGEYSIRTLALTQELGYATVFWSFAYEDWLRDKQPGKEAAYIKVTENLHNGAIILLHAVSQSNTEALPDIIDYARAQGYEFKSLRELPPAVWDITE